MNRRTFLAAGAGLAAGVAADGLAVEPADVHFTEHQVNGRRGDAERQIVVAQVSDLHIHRVGPMHRRIAAEVKARKPDVVLITGDLIDRAADLPVAEEFLALLGEVVAQRGWTVDAAMAVEKRVHAYGLAATGAVTAMAFPENAVTALTLAGVPDAPRRWIGAGAFPFAAVDRLEDLVPVLNRQDQTISHFGFAPAELRAFAAELGGRGVDRIVPIGSALTFSAIWDGYDLPREFTRLTTLET
ncbi:MAG TPA: metallophosphoesterase [Longimicrobiaceae bacterium]|nr:metallophosphoesterase [Longimicrobiaceae bacterium]